MKINKQELLKNELERQKLLEIIKNHNEYKDEDYNYIVEIKNGGVVVLCNFANSRLEIDLKLIPWEFFNDPKNYFQNRRKEEEKKRQEQKEECEKKNINNILN